MTDHSELIKKLRDLHRDPRPASAEWLFENQVALYDAAAAIEALQAENPIVESVLVDKMRQQMEETACHCNMKENAELIAKILDDDVDRKVFELPKQGEWVRKEDELTYWYVCSECGYRPHSENYPYLSDFCPNCGAKMNDSNASNALNALDNAQDGPIITPCRGCSDYDGYGGCKSKGGCAREKMEVQDEQT